MLIAVVLIAITITFLTSGTTFLARTETSASDKALAQGAADFVKDQLLYASEVKVVYVNEENPTPPAFSAVSGFAVLYIGSDDGTEVTNTGRLYYKRPDANGYVDILDGEIYKGKELALDYSATVATAGEGSSKAASFEIAAKVVRDGAQTKEVSHTFRMYNIGLNSEPEYDTSVSSWDEANPDKGKKFYLLITSSSDGYARGGLILELSAINNAADSNGIPYHDPDATTWKDLSGAGNDIDLAFTDNPGAIKDKWISFDGNGDYAKSQAIFSLNAYEKITIEVCFRADSSIPGVMYETSPSWGNASGTLCMMVNTYNGGTYRDGMVFTGARMGTSGNAELKNSSRVYHFANDPAKFTTHTMTYSCVTDPAGRLVFVDGSQELFYTEGSGLLAFSTSMKTYPTFAFKDYILYIAARNGQSLYFKGDIAAMRIYSRKLNPDEIAGNVLMDQLQYN
jgi:hypothetical protein